MFSSAQKRNKSLLVETLQIGLGYWAWWTERHCALGILMTGRAYVVGRAWPSNCWPILSYLETHPPVARMFWAFLVLVLKNIKIG